jgi:hypothetical protein
LTGYGRNFNRHLACVVFLLAPPDCSMVQSSYTIRFGENTWIF